MDVVEAILHSRGFAFTDFARATAYFRHAGRCRRVCRMAGGEPPVRLPVISAQCDVCRDDLLFELEAEAEG